MRRYALILMALLALTALTVTAAGIRFSSPAINVVVALGIASLKASLVAMFFMHLLHDKPMNALIFVSGLVFLAIFLIFCLIDADTRMQVQPAEAALTSGGALACARPVDPHMA
jgi:cytochrome c oxidase subunit 4